jgi:hypothetical protein
MFEYTTIFCICTQSLLRYTISALKQLEVEQVIGLEHIPIGVLKRR